MNTQSKKSAKGKIYQVSTFFKVGDKVAIHNTITGDVSYTGVIKVYSDKGKNVGEHYAVIIVNGGVIENTLKSALVIN